MAAVMVMRPDFSQTYARSVARFGGTIVGVTFATVVVQVADPGPELSAALAVCCAWLMYLLMRTGYAVGQVCISAYVVFLLGMAGTDWSQTVPERIVLTLVGGLLAMVSYAVYPAWETPRLRNRLAGWLIAVGRYAATVIDQYADPAARSNDDVRSALIASREARVEWTETLKKAQYEPVRHRASPGRPPPTPSTRCLNSAGPPCCWRPTCRTARRPPCAAPRNSPTPCAVPPKRGRRRYANGGSRNGDRSPSRWRTGTFSKRPTTRNPNRANPCPTPSCAGEPRFCSTRWWNCRSRWTTGGRAQ